MGRKPSPLDPFRYYRSGSDQHPLYYALNTETNNLRAGFSNCYSWTSIGCDGVGIEAVEHRMLDRHFKAIDPVECPLVTRNLPRDF